MKKIEESFDETTEYGFEIVTTKDKNSSSLWFVILWIVAVLGIVCSTIGLCLLYLPHSKFKSWLITTAMTTYTHQYLATMFYSNDIIGIEMASNRVIEPTESTNANLIDFVDYSTSEIVYKNKYDKEILTREDNQPYKLINIREGNLRGYLVVIYDASKVKLAVSEKLGHNGEMLTTMAKKNNALVAMNASGFFDQERKGNGGSPHGIVIKDGKLLANNAKSMFSGGLIGFDNQNRLILGKYSAQEALNMGIRDAVEFGPYLIVNGNPAFIKGNGGWGSAPRSSIAQREDGIVLFLVLDGRDYIGGIPGATMVQMTNFLKRYGAYNAANLDGGTSSGLVIEGKLTNKPINSEGKRITRKVPDAWILTE